MCDGGRKRPQDPILGGGDRVGGFVDVNVLFFLHFIDSEVEGINCVTFILVELWNVVQFSSSIT